MKNYISLIILSFSSLLFSCGTDPVIPTATPHPSVKEFVTFLEQTAPNSYSIDSEGFPFKKGEYVFEFSSKAETSLKTDIKALESKTLNFINTKLGTNRTSNDIEVVKCDCNDFLFLVKLKIPINGDDKKMVVPGNSDDWVQNVSPNYMAYQNFRDNIMPTKVINYHNNRNPFIMSNTNIPAITQDLGVTSNSFNQNPLVKIALIDTGVMPTSTTRNYTIFKTSGVDNCYSDDYIGMNLINANGEMPSPNNKVFDDNGHGSHITSDILEVVSRNKNNLLFIPIKSHSKDAMGTLFSVTCGIRYATKMGAKVINASWGVVYNDSTRLRVMRHAIEDAGKSQILFVNSAGNDSKDLDKDDYQIYPAMFKNLTNMVVVSSYDLTDINGVRTKTIKDYGNFSENYVDLLAIGTTTVTIKDTLYVARGTSMSAGLVSAVAANIYARNPTITALNAKTTLLSSTYCGTNSIANNRAKNDKILNTIINSTYPYQQ